MSKAKILFQISGSIAAYKACQVISRLVQEGHEVRTAITKGAAKFIGDATLEGLSGYPVFSDVFESGRQMDHIHLARWADLAILCPASASCLNRLAQGLGDDAVGALFLAYELSRKPYLVAPAMNQAMYRHPATTEALSKLKKWGVRVLEAAEGHQACGEEGPGRLPEPDQVFEEILLALPGSSK